MWSRVHPVNAYLWGILIAQTVSRHYVQKATDLIYCIIDVRCNPALREVVKEQPQGDERKLFQVLYAVLTYTTQQCNPWPPQMRIGVNGVKP